MTLLFCDSFDHMVTADMTLKGWTVSAAGITAAAGRFGTDAMRSPNGNFYCSWGVPVALATGGVGFAYRSSSFSSFGIVNFVDGGTVHLHFRINASSGKIEVRRGSSTGTLIATGNAVLTTNTFYYLEFKVTINDSTGVIVTKVNGVEDINVTGQDTQNGGNASYDNIRFFWDGQGNGGTCDVDDLVIWDTAGSVNNDFMGDVRVQAILPSGAGATTEWTPSAGSNYQNVDEAAPNGDTDYNSEATATDVDTFVYGDLTPTSGTVKAVQWLAYARKDDGGTRTVRPVVRHGGTDYFGSSKSVSSSYTYLRHLMETNPGTAAAWTISDVNAAEFGIELET